MISPSERYIVELGFAYTKNGKRVWDSIFIDDVMLPPEDDDCMSIDVALEYLPTSEKLRLPTEIAGFFLASIEQIADGVQDGI